MFEIGITSNIKKYYKGYIDFIDHYWLDYFEKSNIKYYLIPNKKKSSIKALNKIKLLIIPGGNDVSNTLNTSKIRNNIEMRLIKICLKKKIPILGICRGAQLFAKYKKLKITKCAGHMRTKHPVFFDKKFLNYKKKEVVNSFHNYCITPNKRNNLVYLAYDKDRKSEMFVYKKRNIFIMWHPERNNNFKEINKIIKYIKTKFL